MYIDAWLVFSRVSNVVCTYHLIFRCVFQSDTLRRNVSRLTDVLPADEWRIIIAPY